MQNMSRHDKAWSNVWQETTSCNLGLSSFFDFNWILIIGWRSVFQIPSSSGEEGRRGWRIRQASVQWWSSRCHPVLTPLLCLMHEPWPESTHTHRQTLALKGQDREKYVGGDETEFEMEQEKKESDEADNVGEQNTCACQKRDKEMDRGEVPVLVRQHEREMKRLFCLQVWSSSVPRSAVWILFFKRGLEPINLLHKQKASEIRKRDFRAAGCGLLLW